MANQSQRGGQKASHQPAGQRQQHQGVRPGSTTQDKGARDQQRQRQADQRRKGAARPTDGLDG
jgi:hypothetical protein